ncbi:Rus Holliday junction resolvase [uncultured Caudovirales phage]|uniref:Rus Holliday junction resolvase n=1 Tax=uncultured Caudovirales phage TaxID=2100421 RepID=A0A6J5MAW1_9CAUD|nr:Rus Holliday junction resolvase [uncultured Caudovirales phage]
MSAPEVTMYLPGKVIAKGRPRLTRSGIITPGKTRAYESLLRAKAIDAMEGREPLAGPLMVKMSVAVLPPESWSKVKRAAAVAGHILPTVRPDLDNQIKLIDALNPTKSGFRGVWSDDAQVVRIDASRFYAEAAGILIEVYCVTAELE